MQRESGTHCTGPFSSRDPASALGGMGVQEGSLRMPEGFAVKNVIYLGGGGESKNILSPAPESQGGLVSGGKGGGRVPGRGMPVGSP